MDVCFLFIPPSGTKQAVNVALIAKVIGCIIVLALVLWVSLCFAWFQAFVQFNFKLVEVYNCLSVVLVVEHFSAI